MRKSISILSLVVIFMLVNTFPALCAEKYDVDHAHSYVGFSVPHMVLSKTKGKFTDFTTTFMFDEKDLANSSIETVIQVNSISTDDEKRDEHLRSTDFFDVEKYPTITFKSNEIKETGDNQFVAIGDLTIHGVTKEIELPFTIIGKITDPWGNVRLGVESNLTINRKDYGLTWNKVMDNGGLVVGEKVDIELNMEFIQSK